ncbi:MAG: response regulator [Myxococcaceae bacterium]
MSARVLLVENDDGVRDALAELLTSHGCEVESAHDGAEALKCLQAKSNQHLPDVILLDLVMRVMNGWRFASEMRSDPRLATLPVVVLSAVREPLARVARAEAYLSKPLDVGHLKETVERVATAHRNLIAGQQLAHL